MAGVADYCEFLAEFVARDQADDELSHGEVLHLSALHDASRKFFVGGAKRSSERIPNECPGEAAGEVLGPAGDLDAGLLHGAVRCAECRSYFAVPAVNLLPKTPDG